MSLTPAGRPTAVVKEAVALALREDLAGGDVTTLACVPERQMGAAEVVAREALVTSGLSVVGEVFRQVDPEVEVEYLVADGALVEPGTRLAHVHGLSRSILQAERVALNFLQRMCGVAYKTHEYVREIAPGAKTRIVDSRKTTPGLRALERHAVRCGGGYNHRENLSSGVLIKDNHIAAAGGVREAIEAARRWAPHSLRVECEVDTEAQLREALAAGAEVILLDNFDDDAVERAIALNAGKAILEASGGITPARVRRLSELGVDVISVGALTHSAAARDIGLDWAP